MTTKKLELILEQNGIHPKFWPEMKALVFDGTRLFRQLKTRLNHVVNYKDCPRHHPGGTVEAGQAQVSTACPPLDQESGGSRMTPAVDFTGRHPSRPVTSSFTPFAEAAACGSTS